MRTNVFVVVSSWFIILELVIVTLLFLYLVDTNSNIFKLMIVPSRGQLHKLPLRFFCYTLF